jgi:hypothetical protein
MNLMMPPRDRLPFTSAGVSGIASSTVAICARAMSPSFSALQIAFSPPTFDDTSTGRPKCVPISFDNNSQSRASHRDSPFRWDRFRSGTAPTNAPLTSQETPFPLPDGANRNSRIIDLPAFNCDKENISGTSCRELQTAITPRFPATKWENRSVLRRHAYRRVISRLAWSAWGR